MERNCEPVSVCSTVQYCTVLCCTVFNEINVTAMFIEGLLRVSSASTLTPRSLEHVCHVMLSGVMSWLVLSWYVMVRWVWLDDIHIDDDLGMTVFLLLSFTPLIPGDLSS